jgi:hypothetical protein
VAVNLRGTTTALLEAGLDYWRATEGGPPGLEQVTRVHLRRRALEYGRERAFLPRSNDGGPRSLFLEAAWTFWTTTETPEPVGEFGRREHADALLWAATRLRLRAKEYGRHVAGVEPPRDGLTVTARKLLRLGPPEALVVGIDSAP